MKYPPLKSPTLSQKRKVLEDQIANIEAILAGGEQVKGCASKTK